MGILICIKRKNKANIFMVGNTTDALTMTVTVCKGVTKKIARKKGITLDKATKFLTECIIETKDYLK